MTRLFLCILLDFSASERSLSLSFFGNQYPKNNESFSERVCQLEDEAKKYGKVGAEPPIASTSGTSESTKTSESPESLIDKPEPSNKKASSTSQA
ncbi:hypothetical protein RclHR1_02040002 [Rhizophagus clarus]|uniref:Uncharacterized protein n=1 Tax=Rhizophagus clarus TaxID=94130 RepID=A0A2Z6QRG3_9GLOM|nr:hypothetical protein RclHR1_02040002 [Rhizophagus clarus]